MLPHSIRGAVFADDNWLSLSSFPGVMDEAQRYPVVAHCFHAGKDGRVYLGGDFTHVSDIAASGVAMWNGSNWLPLGNGLAGSKSRVRAIETTLSGSVYIGGHFTSAGGSTAFQVAEWNGDSWSPLASGLSGTAFPEVYALESDGTRLYVGGKFTSAGGIPAESIATWDGNAWSALSEGVSGGQSVVYAIEILDSSNILVGGSFEMVGAQQSSAIAIWNGLSWNTVGASFPAVPSRSSSVTDMEKIGDSVYVVGAFAQIGGVDSEGIARWDGENWFAIPSPPLPVAGIITSDGSDLYASVFDGGGKRLHIAKWDGTDWELLDGYVTSVFGDNPTIDNLTFYDGDLYIGGEFQFAGELRVRSVAKWQSGEWSSIGHGISGSNFSPAVHGVKTYNDELVIAGHFDSAGGVAANSITRWSNNAWHQLAEGLLEVSGSQSSPGYVYGLEVDGTDLYVAGDFNTAGTDNTVRNIAKWDGNNWSSVGTRPGPVNALRMHQGVLYAGSRNAYGEPLDSDYVASWNGNGWQSLGSGVDGPVNTLTTIGSDLFVGGSFSDAGGSGARNLAIWDGTDWSTIGEDINGEVLSLTTDDNVLFISKVTGSGLVPPTAILKFENGNLEQLGSAFDKPVRVIKVIGGILYAGGDFSQAGAEPLNSVCRWNGTNWEPLGSGTAGFPVAWVADITEHSNELIVAGHFRTAGSRVSHCVARFIPVEFGERTINLTWEPTENLGVVRWPTSSIPFQLQSSTSLNPDSQIWENVPNAPSIENGMNRIVVPDNETKFFKLRYP